MPQALKKEKPSKKSPPVLKVRISAELLQKSQELADRNHRTLSEQVRFLLDRETSQDRVGG